MTPHEEMMQGFRDLIRAVYLKMAYQLASCSSPNSSCDACGLPATRTFGVEDSRSLYDGAPHMACCPDCRPTDPDLVRVTEHSEARGIERLLRMAKGEGEEP